jgi:two-component system, NarL family, nitrate/nitrite response regulator NarL
LGLVKTIRIFVVDDEPRIRDVLVHYLARCDEFDVVGEASGGIEALEKLASVLPNVVLLDISMPGMNGLDVAKRMLEAHPAIRIIFVSAAWTVQHETAAHQIGASGFVAKDKMATDLAPKIRKVAAGK